MTDNPAPGRYRRLYDLENDPGEFRDRSGEHPEVVVALSRLMLDRFRSTHLFVSPSSARD